MTKKLVIVVLIFFLLLVSSVAFILLRAPTRSAPILDLRQKVRQVQETYQNSAEQKNAISSDDSSLWGIDSKKLRSETTLSDNSNIMIVGTLESDTLVQKDGKFVASIKSSIDGKEYIATVQLENPKQKAVVVYHPTQRKLETDQKWEVVQLEELNSLTKKGNVLVVYVPGSEIELNSIRTKITQNSSNEVLFSNVIKLIL